MPVCKKCGSEFPDRVKINGIACTLSTRRYCLECSPYGGENRRQLHTYTGEPGVCVKCGRISRAGRRSCGGCYEGARLDKIVSQLHATFDDTCKFCGYKLANGVLRVVVVNKGAMKDMSIRSAANVIKSRKRGEVSFAMACSNCAREVKAGVRDASSVLVRSLPEELDVETPSQEDGQ